MIIVHNSVNQSAPLLSYRSSTVWNEFFRQTYQRQGKAHGAGRQAYTNQNEVHRFSFANSGNASRVMSFSDISALGIFSVALYGEKEGPQPMFREKISENASSALQAGSGAGQKKMRSPGTKQALTPYAPGVIAVTEEFKPETESL